MILSDVSEAHCNKKIGLMLVWRSEMSAVHSGNSQLSWHDLPLANENTGAADLNTFLPHDSL